LYGGKASLTVTETPGGGTSVTITVPYVARAQADQPE
jgi:sensor histidine kinase YesM